MTSTENRRKIIFSGIKNLGIELYIPKEYNMSKVHPLFKDLV